MPGRSITTITTFSSTNQCLGPREPVRVLLGKADEFLVVVPVDIVEKWKIHGRYEHLGDRLRLLVTRPVWKDNLHALGFLRSFLLEPLPGKQVHGAIAPRLESSCRFRYGKEISGIREPAGRHAGLEARVEKCFSNQKILFDSRFFTRCLLLWRARLASSRSRLEKNRARNPRIDWTLRC